MSSGEVFLSLTLQLQQLNEIKGRLEGKPEYLSREHRDDTSCSKLMANTFDSG
jgi:hypothetical protein